MNATLLKAMLVLVVVSSLSLWSVFLYSNKRTTSLLVQLIGSVGLIIVAVVHIFEAERWLEFMHWGSPHSVGHYLDLSSAILGIVLFLMGFLLNLTFKNRRDRIKQK